MAKSTRKQGTLDLGEFTRDRVVELLRQSEDANSVVFAAMAATLLASIDLQSSPREVITAALDVLARTETVLARSLLWQAAEHARHPRVRIEAIRRSGGIATPEQCASLRKWAAEGFTLSVPCQHDQIDKNHIRQAAIEAIGHVKKPTKEDVDTIIVAITPPTEMKEFSPAVFKAACEAYWLIGDKASLSRLTELISQRWLANILFPLLSLAGKYSVKELQPYVEQLRKAFCECTGDWPDDSTVSSHLLTLATTIASPEFFQAWTCQHGREGMQHGRGQITSTLLKGLKRPCENTVSGLLSLAKWRCNLSDDTPVMAWLKKCIGASHGKTIAKRLIAEPNEGNSHLLGSGAFYSLYDSVDKAMGDVCEALGTQHEHQRKQIAETVAKGTLAMVRGEGEEECSTTNVTRRNRNSATDEEHDLLVRKVSSLKSLDAGMNPIVAVAKRLSPPHSSPGAMAICEIWSRQGEALAGYVLEMVIREAGRENVLAQDTPMLKHFEEIALAAQPQQPSLRSLLEQALVSEIVVDGQLNRYAIDLMQRTNLSFEKGAWQALHEVQTTDDAQFVLERLHNKGAIGTLTNSIKFHREGEEPLTTHVQATAIAFLTKLLSQGDDRKQRETFVEQLHQRFQDLPRVREAAYRACGDLGGFSSIKPLRERLPSDSVAARAIRQAIEALRDRLIKEKPQEDAVDAVKQWLGFVADLGDPALVSLVKGYLNPPHADLAVRHSALIAIEHMKCAESLEVVKKFMDDTAPEGNTLVIARHARLMLEQRKDVDLFEILSKFYDADDEMLDPTIDYAKLFGSSLPIVTKGLKKSLELFGNGHWDEFVTRISGILEDASRFIFRSRFDKMGIDKDRASKIVNGPYRNLLNVTEFHNTYPMLQAHCSTVYTYRGESPTAHATNTDGSPKAETTSVDAEYVQDEFSLAFAEAVKVLR